MPLSGSCMNSENTGTCSADASRRTVSIDGAAMPRSIWLTRLLLTPAVPASSATDRPRRDRAARIRPPRAASDALASVGAAASLSAICTTALDKLTFVFSEATLRPRIGQAGPRDGQDRESPRAAITHAEHPHHVLAPS